MEFKYLFTTFGDVYAGQIIEECKFPNKTIVIQNSRCRSYRKLTSDEKTTENIKEFGWIIDNNSISQVVSSKDFSPPTQIVKQEDGWNGACDRTVMFIIGAGASANCIYGKNKNKFKQDILRPPLGNALFEKRFEQYQKNYKGIQNLFTLSDSNVINIEDFFEDEWGSVLSGNNEVLVRHMNIQYYLQKILKDVSTKVIKEYSSNNLYKLLASKLQENYENNRTIKYGRDYFKKIAFISFNQDTILETFLENQFNYPLYTLDNYVNVNDSPFCVFKPHGSWNWGWKFSNLKIKNVTTSDWLYDNNINFFQLNFSLLGNYENMVDWSTYGNEASNHEHFIGKYTVNKSQIKIIDKNLNDYYPALLLPYRDKDEFTMPLRHFYKMKGYLSYVETLIIIGWKGNEAVFNRLLKSQAKNIKRIIIADPQANIVESNLRNYLSKNVEIKTYKSFEDFVINGISHEIV